MGVTLKLICFVTFLVAVTCEAQADQDIAEVSYLFIFGGFDDRTHSKLFRKEVIMLSFLSLFSYLYTCVSSVSKHNQNISLNYTLQLLLQVEKVKRAGNSSKNY